MTESSALDAESKHLDERCDQFQADWKMGRRPRIELFLGAAPESERPAWLHELVAVELECRIVLGERPALADYLRRFPDDSKTIGAVFDDMLPSVWEGLAGAPVESAARWYYVGDKQEVGPVARIDLQRLAAAGAIRPRQLLRQENKLQWVPAGAVPGLLPEVICLEVDAFVQRFEKAWRNGCRPDIDDFLPKEGPVRLAVLNELVHVDLEWRLQAGEPARLEDYLERYPELAPFANPTQVAQAPEQKPVAAGPAKTPQHIGRYRVEKILGEGGFGVVFLAHDDQLDRPVAIKVPHAQCVGTPEDAQAYLTEARAVAKLDHPHIVPVFDVGSTAEFPFFFVSKFVGGGTLAKRIKEDRPSFGEAVGLVASIAEALHYAHRQGLVHRDIKPGNIMIDPGGKPSVVDFGLALKEEHVGQGPRYAGTPAYMSPEQARGEGHRVDGRSDIFSLGVVFYELLTGRRPFPAAAQAELMEQITTFEPRPPRQIDDTVPKELERICLKALQKRAAERYTTAKDMADDLRHCFAQSTQEEKLALASAPLAAPVGPTPASTPVATPLPTPHSDSRPARIVPKGLRSFDADDADFFLELLPGPRDRDGLPDSIRFWKTRIEETDPDKTFSVGLIYGPSGCGKSSLVKAGLLPRLSKDVSAVFVEATGRETETRLLSSLRKQCPALPAHLGLKETLAMLRRGQGLPAGKKVLIVLDQFEQWLHAMASRERERPESERPESDPPESARAELMQALRQCDGGRVQSVVMVRDDFWMAVTRFLSQLEIELLQGRNCAAADLFDLDHARKVLAAFGRAFGKLPEQSSETSKEQKEFLKRAVSSLAQDNKVICVRLALFAEMIKGRPWTPATLKEVGGTEGVGVTFLEDTFSSSSANPKHRLHQKAARAVLKALLPESGTDIKGSMRSYAELLEASGYRNRPKDFDDLLRILDNEIRLLTPTDPEGAARDEGAVAVSGGVVSRESSGSSSPLTTHPSPLTTRYYQLTHDYLVHSLREWLTHKQKETKRGRAELLLADRSAVWNARPERRQLPSLLQWFQIKWLTAKKNWTPPQRKMMSKAGRYHAVRGTALGLLLAVATVTGLTIWGQVVEQRKATKAAGMVQAVLNADTAQVPGVVSEMAEYRKWTDPLLRDENDKAAVNSRQKLHASLALLPVDGSQVDYLYGRLLEAAPHEVPVIRDALGPHKDGLLDKLWAVVEKPEKGKESQRLRAASALAKHDPDSEKWAKVQAAVGNDLVAVPAVHLAMWMDSLNPVREKLFAALSDVYRNASRRETERSLATDILADYAADNPHLLADLLMDADEKQFGVIYPKFKEQEERGLPVLTGEIDKKLPPELPSSDERREKLGKRQANAAVALLRMNQPAKVWPLLKHTPDPRVRSYVIHRLSPLGADAKAIVKRVDDEPDLTIRRALLLSLGEFGEREFSPEDRKALLPKLQEMYRTATDPGLHAASEWLLRTWKEEAWLKQVNDEWARDQEQREKRLDGIGKLLAKDKEKTPPQWYVNGQGQTMVVIPGPVEFLMGSPVTELSRSEMEEIQHKKTIGRTFAIAAKSVTVEQYRQFDKFYLPAVFVRLPDLPMAMIDWYKGATYCNWLSKVEGISEEQWCYEIKGNEIKLKANYLSLSGYRLPTQAEMEYATGAGAATSRYFGETDELLSKYAWYDKNSQVRTWPVGSLKPNDFGLFDVHGNVHTWCQESYKRSSQGNDWHEDKEDDLVVISTYSRVLRGGSFVDPAWKVRSAYRGVVVPAYSNGGVGCRAARTFTP